MEIFRVPVETGMFGAALRGRFAPGCSDCVPCLYSSAVETADLAPSVGVTPLR